MVSLQWFGHSFRRSDFVTKWEFGQDGSGQSWAYKKHIVKRKRKLRNQNFSSVKRKRKFRNQKFLRLKLKRKFRNQIFFSLKRKRKFCNQNF